MPGKAVRALFACDPYFDLKHSAVLLYGRLLSPAAVAGVHAQPQFLLLRVLVVVFLDGPGTVSGHLCHMEDDGSGIQLAGDESSPCRVPRHFLVDAPNRADLIQRFADLRRETAATPYFLFVCLVLPRVNGGNVVIDSRASVLVDYFCEPVDEQGLGQLRELRAPIDNRALLLVNHVPRRVDDIDVRHAVGCKS